MTAMEGDMAKCHPEGAAEGGVAPKGWHLACRSIFKIIIYYLTLKVLMSNRIKESGLHLKKMFKNFSFLIILDDFQCLNTWFNGINFHWILWCIQNFFPTSSLKITEKNILLNRIQLLKQRTTWCCLPTN